MYYFRGEYPMGKQGTVSRIYEWERLKMKPTVEGSMVSQPFLTYLKVVKGTLSRIQCFVS